MLDKIIKRIRLGIDDIHIDGNCLVARVGKKFYASAFLVSSEIEYGASDAEQGELLRFLRNYTYTLSQMPPGIEVRIIKTRHDTARTLRRIENEMVNIKALLERVEEPHARTVLEKRLLILKKIYEHIVRTRDIERVVLVIKTVATDTAMSKACSEAVRSAKYMESLLRLGLGIKTKLANEAMIRKIMYYELGIAEPPDKAILIDHKRLSLLAPLPYRKKPPIENSDGVFIGHDIETGWPVVLDRNMLNKHILIIGPTGRGKTTLLASILENLSVLRDAMFTAIDFKGDLARMAEKSGVAVVDARRYPVNLVIRPPGITQIDWSLSVAEVVGKILRIDPSSLSRILSLLISNNKPVSPEKILVDRSLAVLAPIIDMITSEPRYGELYDILRGNTVIDISRGGTAYQNIYGGIIVSIMKHVYKERHGGLRLVVIDEAWRISMLEPLIELVKEGRSRGIGVVLATQNIEDIPAEVIDNIYTLMVFGSSSDDYLEKVRRKLGLRRNIVAGLKYLDIGEIILVNMLNPQPLLVRIRPPLWLEQERHIQASTVMNGGLT